MIVFMIIIIIDRAQAQDHPPGDVRKKKFTEHQLDMGMKRSQSMFALDSGRRMRTMASPSSSPPPSSSSSSSWLLHIRLWRPRRRRSGSSSLERWPWPWGSHFPHYDDDDDDSYSTSSFIWWKLVFTMNSLNPAFHMTLSQMQILVDFSREFWQRFRKNVANIFLFSSETWMNITSNTTLT